MPITSSSGGGQCGPPPDTSQCGRSQRPHTAAVAPAARTAAAFLLTTPSFIFLHPQGSPRLRGKKKNCFGVGVTRSRHTIQSNIRSGALTVAAVAPLGRPRGFRSSGSGRQGPQGADAAKTARPQGKHAAAVTTAAAARPARATGTGKGPAARRRRGVSCRYYFLQISNEEGCLSYGEGDGAKSFRRAERFS